MLIHNVYFWFKEGVSEAEKSDFEQGIRDLAAAVPQVQQARVGRPAATPAREVVDHSFGRSLFFWFNNVEDHNAYQAHPAHELFVQKFQHLWARVQVMDSQLGGGG
ncbi:MAG: Dabb family protein [Bacteroidetes bacterium]|nr:MAG: Dabb family protein [Bacteroidota bacterium]